MGCGSSLLTYAALDYTQAGLGVPLGIVCNPKQQSRRGLPGVTTAIAPPHAAERSDTDWPDVNTEGFSPVTVL